MAVVEKKVRDHTYKIGALDSFDQLHVFRRISPVLPSIFGALISANQLAARQAAPPPGDGTADAEMVEPTVPAQPPGILGIQLLQHAGPLFTFFAHQPDEEVNYIVRCCLGAVERQQGQAWAQVVTKPAVPGNHATRQVQFADLTMGDLLQLTVAVIQENLGDFFSIAGLMAFAGGTAQDKPS